MISKYLDKRFITLFLLPLSIGSLSVLSFQPFNLTFVNFFILPACFYLIVYIKKKSKGTYRKKPYKKKSYKDKKWLVDVARKVKYNAVRYERQLKSCPLKEKRSFWDIF